MTSASAKARPSGPTRCCDDWKAERWRFWSPASATGSWARSCRTATRRPASRTGADVRKLLVHPDSRRRGITKLLIGALERHARQSGRSLLTLDTRTGDKAELLYASLGYRTAGIISGYCRDPFADRLDATTLMYKAS